MMGDLANVYEPAWSAVNFWREYYAKQYEKISTLVYVRDKNFANAVKFERNNTVVSLKLLNPSNTAARMQKMAKLNCDEILFVSNSPVEDHQLMNLQSGAKKISNLGKNQFLMLDTIEQMFALTQHAGQIYTDRYHPGVIGYRFAKEVHLLDLSGAAAHDKSMAGQNSKLVGLYRLMQDYPDAKVIEQERIPNGFQKLRDALRTLRRRRSNGS